jgi:hypothetical protein
MLKFRPRGMPCLSCCCAWLDLQLEPFRQDQYYMVKLWFSYSPEEVDLSYLDDFKSLFGCQSHLAACRSFNNITGYASY